jgi:two-component system NtrC family sensor kinase
MPDPFPIGIYWWNMMNLGFVLAFVSSVYSRTASRMERELLDQNQELRETQTMLVQSEKMAAVGKLAAGLTHEINNPIGAILSNTQTGVRAVKRIREQEETVKGAEHKNIQILDNLDQSLDSTTEAAHRISQLVSRMKSFVQLDKAELKSTDLHKGFESTIALMQDQFGAGNIEVIYHFDQKLPRVLCRPAEINQVLMHLLQNAIDAIEGPGTITITTGHDAEQVTIAISDTGRGLTAEERKNLFDLEFSSKGPRVKLGMGLPISHQIITRHGGELRVESTPGEGSTFTVVLPRQISTESN